MRILYIGPTGFPGRDGGGGGAVGRCMHMIAKGLVREGHQVTVAMINRGTSGPPSDCVDGISVHWSNVLPPGYPLSTLRRVKRFMMSRYNFVRTIGRLVGANQPDWIIVYSTGLEAVLPCLFQRLRHKVRFALQHGDIFDAATWGSTIQELNLVASLRIGLPFCSLVLNSGSEQLGQQMRQLWGGANVVPVPPPVDVELFASADGETFRARHGLAGERLITYLGGFKSFEGLEDLIDAAVPLLRDDSSLRLVLAGGGGVPQDLSRVQAYAARRRGAEQVWFPGMLELREVTQLLATSTVIVLPKTDHPANRAAMPIKLGEYLASGRPVVSAAVGGIVERLRHGENGLLCQPGDIVAMRGAIERVLQDPEEAVRLGHNGRQTAWDALDIGVVARNLTAALSEAMER